MRVWTLPCWRCMVAGNCCQTSWSICQRHDRLISHMSHWIRGQNQQTRWEVDLWHHKKKPFVHSAKGPVRGRHNWLSIQIFWSLFKKKLNNSLNRPWAFISADISCSKIEISHGTPISWRKMGRSDGVPTKLSLVWGLRRHMGVGSELTDGPPTWPKHHSGGGNWVVDRPVGQLTSCPTSRPSSLASRPISWYSGGVLATASTG